MPKITLKRVIDINGTTAELYPTTTLDQIISEGTGAEGADESLSSYLGNTFIPLSQKGATNGVATLESGKVPFSQLPSSVTGGMKFVGTIDASAGDTEANAVELSVLFDELTYANFATTDAELEGSYRVVTDAGFVKNTEGTMNVSAYYEFRVGQEGASALDDPIGEEGDNSSPIHLEKGDWIVFTARIVPTEGVRYYTFSIINNTYQNADTSVKGVVQLSDAADTSELSGDEVITESVLDGLIGSIGDANKLALADHNHDSRYYTEDEIEDLFSGTTTITGYNNDDWDAAYDGEITNLTYSNGTITLARSNGDQDDLTVSITGSLNLGDNSLLSVDKLTFRKDLDGEAEIPGWSLGEYDNEISAIAFTGTQTNYYPIVNTNNLVSKATAADFEKIFYLASGDTNTDTTIGSIIIQVD